MKLRHGQIINEQYRYGLTTGANEIRHQRGRRDGVLELVWWTAWNDSQSDMLELTLYKWVRGLGHRLFYDVTFETKTLDYRLYEVYLQEGDEFGFVVTPNAAGDIIEIATEWIWHADRDKEPFEPR